MDAYFLLFMAAFFVLAASFEFPFPANQGIIVIAYYAMVATSILQVFMAEVLFRVLSDSRTLNLLALVAGVAAGILQIIGYARWFTAIPVLSDSLNSGALLEETVFALERMLNAYLGMGLGEHAGTLFMALWLVFAGLAARETTFIPRSVRFLMLASGWALGLVALEARGGPFVGLGSLTVALWGVFYAFIIVSVAALLNDSCDNSPASIHWGLWIFTVVFWLGNVIPAFL